MRPRFRRCPAYDFGALLTHIKMLGSQSADTAWYRQGGGFVMQEDVDICMSDLGNLTPWNQNERCKKAERFGVRVFCY